MVTIRYHTARQTASNPHSLIRQIIVDTAESEAETVHDAVYESIHDADFDSFSPPLHEQLEQIARLNEVGIDALLVERVLWERARAVTKEYAIGGMFDWDNIEAVGDPWRNVTALVGILEYGVRNGRPS